MTSRHGDASWTGTTLSAKIGRRNPYEVRGLNAVPNSRLCWSLVRLAVCNPAVNASDNRMAAGQNWSYDAAGNVIAAPQGRSFIYNAENKQFEVENALEQNIGTYWFDGDGKRIKKEGLAPNGQPELTVFVNNAAGTLIGEYSTNVERAMGSDLRYCDLRALLIK